MALARRIPNLGSLRSTFFSQKKKKKNIRFETYVRDGKSREENKKTLRNDVC